MNFERATHEPHPPKVRILDPTDRQTHTSFGRAKRAIDAYEARPVYHAGVLVAVRFHRSVEEQLEALHGATAAKRGLATAEQIAALPLAGGRRAAERLLAARIARTSVR